MKFNTVKLGEYLYIKGRIGWKGLKKKEYLDKSDFRIINGESLTENGIDWNKAGYISKERYDESPEIMLQPDDILISKDGTIGKIGYVDSLETPTTVASGIFVIRNQKPEIINTRFIYHFFCSKYFKNFIAMRTEGSVIPHLYQKDFVDLDFPLPQLSVQDKIVGILDAICNKIDLNKSINENLEQQIEAIFNNKYAPSLCCPNWGVGTIGDVVTLQRGYDLPKDKMVPGSYPVAGSTDTIFYHNDYTTESPCVVMGRSGNIGKPRLYMERCWAHNTTLFVKDFKGNNPYWSYYMLRSIDYSQFRGGSAVPTLNRNHVHSFEISIPPVNQQNEFAEMILPLLLLIENNRKEIKLLSTLRETLLPKLMAGEIDISDIQF